MSDILQGMVDKVPLLRLLNDRYPGYHPILSLADIAFNEDNATDYKLQVDCHKTIAKYVAPALASIEMQGSMDINAGLLRVQYSSDLGDIPTKFIEDNSASLGAIPVSYIEGEL